MRLYVSHFAELYPVRLRGAVFKEIIMSTTEEEKKIAVDELEEALKDLSRKEALPLREKAMVLVAIEKIEGDKS